MDSFSDFGKETNWYAGLIIGIVFVAVAVLVICFYILRWKRKQLAPNQPSTRVELHLDVDNEIILLVRSNHFKGPFFSENLMGLKKICQITILNLNFWNYILFVFVLQLIFRLTPLTSVAKKAGNSNDEFKIVKRHICLSL